MHIHREPTLNLEPNPESEPEPELDPDPEPSLNCCQATLLRIAGRKALEVGLGGVDGVRTRARGT